MKGKKRRHGEGKRQELEIRQRRGMGIIGIKEETGGREDLQG